MAAAQTTGTAVVGAGVTTAVTVAAAGGTVLAAGAKIVGALEASSGLNLESASGALRTGALRLQFAAVRRAHWKSEAANNAAAYSDENLERMQSGRAPIGEDGAPMELHHIVPLSQGGTNDASNLRAMTQTEHRRGENYKKNHPNDD